MSGISCVTYVKVRTSRNKESTENLNQRIYTGCRSNNTEIQTVGTLAAKERFFGYNRPYRHFCLTSEATDFSAFLVLLLVVRLFLDAFI